ncbi:hypothetical protein MP638_002514 [Amoeboaphelidium occidentale]|nr:hypothetical protein MP638_002514 [Amoeboaphelidium occidentale]
MSAKSKENSLSQPLLQGQTGPSAPPPPAYVEYPTDGALLPNATAPPSPPGYFDFSLVPAGTVLYSSQITPELLQKSSIAAIERSSDGVVSYDEMLDSNPDELWLYFLTYMKERPSYALKIVGTHQEFRHDHHESTHHGHNHNHNHVSHTSGRTETVTDFSITIDLTQYISEHWERVLCQTSQNGAGFMSFRDVLEAYTRSDKKLKEIQVKKLMVGWDMSKLEMAIRNLIRSSMYHGDVSIQLVPLSNSKITARSSSPLMKTINNCCFNVLCVLSCLCIFVYPIIWAYKKSVKDNIVTLYPTRFNDEHFYRANFVDIYNAVIYRRTANFLARV